MGHWGHADDAWQQSFDLGPGANGPRRELDDAVVLVVACISIDVSAMHSQRDIGGLEGGGGGVADQAT